MANPNVLSALSEKLESSHGMNVTMDGIEKAEPEIIVEEESP